MIESNDNLKKQDKITLKARSKLNANVWSVNKLQKDNCFKNKNYQSKTIK